MIEFVIDFRELLPNGTIMLHDTAKRKKPLTVGAFVKCVDAAGTCCHGIIEKIDAQTGILLIALDRTTYITA